MTGRTLDLDAEGIRNVKFMSYLTATAITAPNRDIILHKPHANNIFSF